jgi:hypothetical protein
LRECGNRCGIGRSRRPMPRIARLPFPVLP